jgi:hypothetical protein
MIKLCYITIVNENYLPFLHELLKTHQKFSKTDLIVYTVNFTLENYNYDNVTFITYQDNNLSDYDNNRPNKYISNDYEKHKYTTFLKPKILQDSPDEYDYYFFTDVDILFTKNSDILLLNMVKNYDKVSYPISVRYFYDYSDTHDKSKPIFNQDGSFNIKSSNYYNLIELYNTEYNSIPYLTTYCMFYTKDCFSFFKEVVDICFDEKVIGDYKKYLPLGDETAFNYLYSKYNITDCISSHLCYDINPFRDIQETLNNVEKSREFVSFIHTKRVEDSHLYGKELKPNLTEYSQIFEKLVSFKTKDNNGYIIDIESDKIHFCVNVGYNDIHTVKIISLFEPTLEIQYTMDITDGYCYWVYCEHSKIIKDLYFIIYDDTRNIKDTIKIS